MQVVVLWWAVQGSVALLGPLCVSPAVQKQGIGSALIRAGHGLLQGEGVSRVMVLGDPAYYSRFGFETESAIAPPYKLPPEWREAWRSIALGADDQPSSGALLLPSPWMHQSLWLP